MQWTKRGVDTRLKDAPSKQELFPCSTLNAIFKYYSVENHHFRKKFNDSIERKNKPNSVAAKRDRQVAKPVAEPTDIQAYESLALKPSSDKPNIVSRRKMKLQASSICGGSRKSSRIAAKQIPKKQSQSVPIGTAVKKYFYDEKGVKRLYSGMITEYDPKEGLYRIKYEDGDREQLDEMELSEVVAFDDVDDMLSYISTKHQEDNDYIETKWICAECNVLNNYDECWCTNIVNGNKCRRGRPVGMKNWEGTNFATMVSFGFFFASLCRIIAGLMVPYVCSQLIGPQPEHCYWQCSFSHVRAVIFSHVSDSSFDD